MHPASFALSQLRDSTKAAHSSLEGRLIIAGEGAGLTDYIAYIAALWGWMKPFEEGLWNRPWPAAMAAAERSNKCAWIEQDLRAFGMTPDEILSLPTCALTSNLDSPAARFGLAYVVEGAQLGNQVLRKRLSPVTASWQPRWLQGYGASTGNKWRNFVQCLEEALSSETLCRTAADAAEQAFVALTCWVEAQNVCLPAHHPKRQQNHQQVFET